MVKHILARNNQHTVSPGGGLGEYVLINKTSGLVCCKTCKLDDRHNYKNVPPMKRFLFVVCACEFRVGMSLQSLTEAEKDN